MVGWADGRACGWVWGGGGGAGGFGWGWGGGGQAGAICQQDCVQISVLVITMFKSNNVRLVISYSLRYILVCIYVFKCVLCDCVFVVVGPSVIGLR